MNIMLFIAGIINTDPLPQPGTDNAKLTDVMNLVFAIVTSIALLMIVISGFRYILAHGDANATAQARNSLLYSVVGLVVTMAAYAIVTFVVKGIS